VAPAAEIGPLEEGRTLVDPNHSHVLAIDNPAWLDTKRASGWTANDGYWGSETGAMHELFDRLALGRRSVAIVANGGPITLDEVEQHVRADRPIAIVAGSGRAADALASVLRGTTPPDAGSAALRSLVEARMLASRAHLFHFIELEAEASELVELLGRLLSIELPDVLPLRPRGDRRPSCEEHRRGRDDAEDS
jgi:hypothetical protein